MRRPDLLARPWTELALLLLGVLAPLLLLAGLTEDVFREGGPAWDRTGLAWLAAHRTPALTGLALALAVVGGTPLLPLLTGAVALWLARAGARAHAGFLAAAVGGAILLDNLLKLAVERPRPSGLGAVLSVPGFSFPSGHAMSNLAFGLALGLVFQRSRWGWGVAVLGLTWAALVGASRNYLGVHYPSDVLAGFAASAAWVTVLYLILGRRWPALRVALPAPVHQQGGIEVSRHPAHRRRP